MEGGDAAAQLAAKMRRDGLPESVVRQFCHYYGLLVQQQAGYIPSAEAQPVEHLPALAALDERCAAIGRALLDKVVIWKLNGGLGAGMGMHGAKSALSAKGPLSFLDIAARQVLAQRRISGARLPLVLMESCHNRRSASPIDDYGDLAQDLPLRLWQHRVPKVCADTLLPVSWPEDPEKEWCPPGHGDLYTALASSGALAQMLAAGYEYAFVANADNLGAVCEPRILGYMAQRGLAFLMEVALRTPADRKGGHLARRSDGRLMLREAAQCPPDETHLFQDAARYHYFNTNNLWIHLPSLQALLDAQGGALRLPLIRNLKTVDPLDPSSPQVYHLETAIGAALELFARAEALLVPRSRFIPVKTTNDLLLLWSDAYQLTPSYRLRLSGCGVGFEGTAPPVVDLDPRYYRCVHELQAHFPAGVPSLRNCRQFKVTGEVYFGRHVSLKGTIHIINERPSPLVIPDGVVLTGEVRVAQPRPRWVECPTDGTAGIYVYPWVG